MTNTKNYKAKLEESVKGKVIVPASEHVDCKTVEDELGKTFQRGANELHVPLLTQRISMIVQLIISDLRVEGGVGAELPLSDQGYDCNPVLSIKLTGKDVAHADKLVRYLIKDTPLHDAYIKPTSEEIMTNYSNYQELLFNPDHDGKNIMKNMRMVQGKVSEIKFDLEKLSKMSTDDFEKTMISIQSKKVAIAKFVDENSTDVGRIL